jgi:hypothetical protein
MRNAARTPYRNNTNKYIYIRGIKRQSSFILGGLIPPPHCTDLDSFAVHSCGICGE